MAEIIPTILTRDSGDLEEKIRKLQGEVSRVQIDIIDGIFLAERSVNIETLEDLETSLKIDVHLMVKEPTFWIDKCVKSMADRIIGQVEMMENQKEFIEKAISAGLGVGLALDLATPVSTIEEILPNLDLVLVLSRKAGFGGGEFEKKALEKVKYLRNVGIPSLDICVDGGINEGNIKECVKAGADLLAVGGAIWKAEDISEEIRKLKSLAGWKIKL